MKQFRNKRVLLFVNHSIDRFYLYRKTWKKRSNGTDQFHWMNTNYSNLFRKNTIEINYFESEDLKIKKTTYIENET